MSPVAAAAPASQVSLSPDDARLITLRAQGLTGTEGRRGGVPGMLRRIGAVQLDTISVLARSHELVAYARLGAVGRADVEAAYWGGEAFEYWAHAACVLPIESWPWMAGRRRRYLSGVFTWKEARKRSTFAGSSRPLSVAAMIM